jgi:hypothetical protein
MSGGRGDVVTSSSAGGGSGGGSGSGRGGGGGGGVSSQGIDHMSQLCLYILSDGDDAKSAVKVWLHDVHVRRSSREGQVLLVSQARDLSNPYSSF